MGLYIHQILDGLDRGALCPTLKGQNFFKVNHTPMQLNYVRLEPKKKKKKSEFNYITFTESQ